MTDKQVIIDGVQYDKCKGCKLYNGKYCTASKSYEPDGKAHKAICNSHMVEQFWVVYKQLLRKEQECGQLKCLLEGVQKSLEAEIEGRSKWSQLETEARFELVKTKQQLDKLKAERDSYIDEYFMESQKVLSLRKVLKEIKEIVTNFYQTGFLRTDNGCILINNNTCVETLEKILQKISEVEDG